MCHGGAHSPQRETDNGKDWSRVCPPYFLTSQHGDRGSDKEAALIQEPPQTNGEQYGAPGLQAVAARQ